MPAGSPHRPIRTGTSTMSAFPTLSTPAGPVPSGAPTWNRQRRSQMPSHRYRDVYSKVDIPLTERQWPDDG